MFNINHQCEYNILTNLYETISFQNITDDLLASPLTPFLKIPNCKKNKFTFNIIIIIYQSPSLYVLFKKYLYKFT